MPSPSVAAAPTDLEADVLADLTSVSLTWVPPQTPLDTSGYQIDYINNDGHNNTVDISYVSTSSHVLTGLQNGTTYNISIIGTSAHFFSEPMTIMVELIQPGRLVV